MDAADGLGLLLDHDVLDPQEHAGRVDNLRDLRLDDFAGLADPVVLGLGLGVLQSDGLHRRHDALVGNRHQVRTEPLLDLLGRASGRAAVRPADGENPRVLHPRRRAQQAGHLLDVVPVAAGHEDDLLALLVPLGKVHPAVAAERLREEGGGQAHVDELTHHGRFAFVRREVDDHQRVGPFELRGHFVEVGRRNEVAPHELHVAELGLERGEVGLELGDLFGGVGQIRVARPARIDQVDFGRRQFRPVGRRGGRCGVGCHSRCQ